MYKTQECANESVCTCMSEHEPKKDCVLCVAYKHKKNKTEESLWCLLLANFEPVGGFVPIHQNML